MGVALALLLLAGGIADPTDAVDLAPVGAFVLAAVGVGAALWLVRRRYGERRGRRE